MPPSKTHSLKILQTPVQAEVPRPKSISCLDPPLILQVRVEDSNDPKLRHSLGPQYFMKAMLWYDTKDQPSKHTICGNSTSPGHYLRGLGSDIESIIGCYFIFDDITCENAGSYRLRVALYGLRPADREAEFLSEVTTLPFSVFSAKASRGLVETTLMTLICIDQGVKLKLKRRPKRRRPLHEYEEIALRKQRRAEATLRLSERHPALGSSYTTSAYAGHGVGTGQTSESGAWYTHFFQSAAMERGQK